MRITFDITGAKQVPFFQPMIRRLHAERYGVSLVTRDWHELNLVRKHFGMRATSLGRHGGPTLLGKLLSSSARAHLLAGHFARHRPDLQDVVQQAEAVSHVGQAHRRARCAAAHSTSSVTCASHSTRWSSSFCTPQKRFRTERRSYRHCGDGGRQ